MIGVVERDPGAVEGGIPDVDINARAEGLRILKPDSILNQSAAIITASSVGPETGKDPASLLTLLDGRAGESLDTSGGRSEEEGDEAGSELHFDFVGFKRGALWCEFE